jgi:hypothetical protein
MSESDKFINEALLFGKEESFTRRETLGQMELIHSTRLPKEGDWLTLTRWGIVQGPEVNELFYSVTLPTGWHIAPTSQSIWSDLIDARGLKRASIFYKATVYDLEAYLTIKPRFVGEDISYEIDDPTVRFLPSVKDKGLDQTVAVLDPIQYAYLTTNPNYVGMVMGDTFLYGAEGDYNGAYFTQTTAASEATIITADEFYENYHRVGQGEHPTLYATNALMKQAPSDFISQLPTDDSVWDEEYDFPAINVSELNI